jgi:hypothetical protein
MTTTTLIDFLDIRFGDPIMSLALTLDGVVFGSAMGSIVYYNLVTNQAKLIKEACREAVIGLSFQGSQTVVGTIGNRSGIMLDHIDTAVLE